MQHLTDDERDKLEEYGRTLANNYDPKEAREKQEHPPFHQREVDNGDDNGIRNIRIGCGEFELGEFYYDGDRDCIPTDLADAFCEIGRLALLALDENRLLRGEEKFTTLILEENKALREELAQLREVVPRLTELNDALVMLKYQRIGKFWV